MQALYYEDVNKVVDQAAQEKAMKENLILYVIPIVAEDTKSREYELQTFDEAWNHPDPKLQRKW